MYFEGISIFGMLVPLTGPISTLTGTYPSLQRYLALILCKKARQVRFGSLYEFPRGTSVLSGNWPYLFGVFQFLGLLGL